MVISPGEKIIRGRIERFRSEGKLLILNEDDFEIKVELELKGFLTTSNGMFEVSEGFLLTIQARFESYLEKAGEQVAQNLTSASAGGVILQVDSITIQVLEKAINDSIEALALSPQAEEDAKQIISKSFNMAIRY